MASAHITNNNNMIGYGYPSANAYAPNHQQQSIHHPHAPIMSTAYQAVAVNASAHVATIGNGHMGASPNRRKRSAPSTAAPPPMPTILYHPTTTVPPTTYTHHVTTSVAYDNVNEASSSMSGKKPRKAATSRAKVAAAPKEKSTSILIINHNIPSSHSNCNVMTVDGT
jgi:hypothetical protein